MKKKNLLLIISLLLVTSCSSYSTNNITFEEYSNKIKEMTEEDKCIVLFSQDSCGYCKILRPILNKYIKNDKEDNIPIYRVDLTIKDGNYTDSTIGSYKDKENDLLYKLDKRISDYKVECNISTDDLLDMYSSSDYFNYVCTPLFIFYQGGKEVYINSNFQALVNDNDDVDYDDFKEYIKFKDNYKYSKEFSL